MSKATSLLLMAFILFGCAQKEAEEKAKEAEQQEQAANAQPKTPQFNELEWKIVDRNKALEENPDLVEVDNDSDAKDPISAISKMYFSPISRINKTTMEHNAKLQSFINAADGAEDPKPPTFEEFNRDAKLNSNNVKGLKPWQVYAYDETTGKVTILEDRSLKKRLFEEQGLKFEEEE